MHDPIRLSHVRRDDENAQRFGDRRRDEERIHSLFGDREQGKSVELREHQFRSDADYRQLDGEDHFRGKRRFLNFLLDVFYCCKGDKFYRRYCG